MTLRKTTKFDKSQHSKADEFIRLLCDNCDKMQLGCRVREILKFFSIDQYFLNLEINLRNQNLLFCKKYDVPFDGIYILIRGQVGYESIEKVKTSIQANNKSFGSKMATNSIILSSFFSTFVIKNRNCQCIEDSVFLKITEQQALDSKYYELKNTRMNLYENHYLSIDHQNLLCLKPSTYIFKVDLNLLNNFQKKKYSFRNEIRLRSFAIIEQGTAKLKIRNSNTYQFDRYGVLVPFLNYEVTSAELVLMVIKNNETLSVHEKFVMPKQGNINSHKDQKPNQFKTCYENFFITNKKPEVILPHNQKVKHQKYISRFSKKMENYSIISTYLCKKNLQFVRKKNFDQNLKGKKEKKLKQPLVLFKPTMVTIKKDLPTFNVAKSSTQPKKKAKIFKMKPEKENMSLEFIMKKVHIDSFNRKKITNFLSVHQKKTNRLEKEVLRTQYSPNQKIFNRYSQIIDD